MCTSFYRAVRLLAAIIWLCPLLCQLQRRRPQGAFTWELKDEVPLLKTTYVVTYNTSSIGDVTTECGKYYATAFLGHFLQLGTDGIFDNICASYSIRPQAHSVARVRIMESQVEMNTYLNISGMVREDIINCSTDLMSEFETPIVSRPFSEITATNSCTAAQIVEDKLKHEDCQWKCQLGDWTFVDSEKAGICDSNSIKQIVWRCLPPCRDFVGSCYGVKEGSTCIRARQIRECLQYQQSIENELFDTCWPLAEAKFRNFTLSETSRGGQVGNCENISDLAPLPTTTVTPTTTSVTIPTTTLTTQPGKLDWAITLLGRESSNSADPILVLEEGGPPKSITFSVQINDTVCAGASNCNLSVEIHFSHVDGPLFRCREGRTIPQIVLGQPTGQNIQSIKNNFCRVGLDQSSTQLSVGHSPINVTVPLRARIDGKYDGDHIHDVILGLSRTVNGQTSAERLEMYKIQVNDRDRKATCKSINDPHIGTFDGLEYNTYSHGEYVFYRSTDGRYQVNVVFQACSATVNASCNCAVAVRSGDDTFVVNRCRRVRPFFRRLYGQERDITIMEVSSYINGQLTPGTFIRQKDDGKKMFIYLPTGSFIKVLVNADLINVWLVPSTAEYNQTQGLCGTYDGNRMDDMTLPNGTVADPDVLTAAFNNERAQARVFSEFWRVEIGGPNSLLNGVPASKDPLIPTRYCLCEMDPGEDQDQNCGVSFDVETCDIYQGIDVTDIYTSVNSLPEGGGIGISGIPGSSRRRRSIQMESTAAVASVLVPSTRRHKRQTNTIVDAVRNIDPIDVNTKFKPPVYKWMEPSEENEALAKDFCETYLRNFPVGELCAMVANVNFEQEIRTCVEDIQINKGDRAWADSARDALKEQCLEELGRNGSIPNDFADRIANLICINECSQEGTCVKGKCQCNPGFTTSDCSVAIDQPPYAGAIDDRGLCDENLFDCSRVRVFGEDFINSSDLTCVLQKVTVDQFNYTLLSDILRQRAIYINFNTVECRLLVIRPYLISISNDGNITSDPLLFIPFNSICNSCSTNTTTCTKKPDTCIIEAECYREDQTSEVDPCLVCEPDNSPTDWTELPETQCGVNPLKLEDWAVAVIGAAVGSVVGVLFGLALYRICCKSRKDLDERNRRRQHNVNDQFEPSITDESMLHRNRGGLSAFSVPDVLNDGRHGRFNREPYFQNDGRGVENGVDETTYF